MTQDRSMGRSIIVGAAHVDNNEKFNRLLNSRQNPRTMYAALLALANAGALGKLREGATA